MDLEGKVWRIQFTDLGYRDVPTVSTERVGDDG